MRVALSHIMLFLMGALLTMTVCCYAGAQTICSASSPKDKPCLDQPREGDTKITGRVTVDSTTDKPTAGAVIKITIGSSDPQTAQVNSDGTFILTGLSALNQYNKIKADQTAPAPPNGGAMPTTGDVSVSKDSSKSNDVPTRFTLGLFGVNAAGSSSSGPSQQYFAELHLVAPLRFLGRGCGASTEGDSLSERCWVWLSPRIASVPTATSTALGSLNSTSLTTTFGSQTVGQITQSFEFQAGAEYSIIKPSSTNFWGMGNSWVKSGASLIFGGGGLTPFNSITTAPEYGLSSNLAQQFNQIPSLASTYPQLATALCNYGFTPPSSGGVTCPAPPTTKPTTVAFVFPNRSRFYRDVYAGLRLRFFYFNGSCRGKDDFSCQAASIFPGTFDLRVGEDESVTGGHLVPLVVTLAGSFPIPGTNGAIRVFGSSYLRAYRNKDATALVMVPSTSFTSLDNAAVAVQSINRSDQDYYRLGLGIDLFPLLSKLK